MNHHWPFIIAAYAIAIGGAGALSLASLIAMRRAERHDRGRDGR